jgi:hypothetical protein
LIAEGVATLEEIERHWSLNDVYKANAVLDFVRDVQKEQVK